MAEEKKTEKTHGQEIDEFRKGLREACLAQLRGRSTDAVRLFFCDHRKIPEELDGCHDRSCGYHWITTMMRCFGEEGVVLATRLYPYDPSVGVACRNTLGKELYEIAPAGDRTLAKSNLVAWCRSTVDAIRAVMRTEPDHVMQHQLTNLVAELQWCEREYSPKS